MWRYRWVAVGVAWAIWLGAFGWVMSLRDVYGASAQIFVDTDNVLRPLLRGLYVESDVMSDVAVMTRTLVTRPNLEKVARATDLDLSHNPDAVVRSLMDRVAITKSRRENIYTITFVDSNPKTAFLVVDRLVDTFVEDTLGSGQLDSDQAETALRNELKAYELRLVEAEDRLKDFKQRNVGMMPGAHGDYYAQLQRANEELAAAAQQKRIAERKLASLDRQLEGEEPTFGLLSGTGMTGSASQYDGEIARLEQQVRELLVEFTEKHPEVVRNQRLLDELMAKRAEEIASMPEESYRPAVSEQLELNPVYQNLRIQRSNVAVELASLRAQVADRQANVDRLKELVDVIPKVEAELKRLNRDYGVVKERHTAMLDRWEDLQTAKRVQGEAETKFKVVEPPYAPKKTGGPAAGPST